MGMPSMRNVPIALIDIGWKHGFGVWLCCKMFRGFADFDPKIRGDRHPSGDASILWGGKGA